MLELSVRVRNGSQEIEVRSLVDPELTVLVSGQELVPRHGREVSTVDSFVMMELSQG